MDESESWYSEYVKICQELEAAVNNNQEYQQSEEGNSQSALSDANVSRLNCSNQNKASNSAPDAPSALNASAPQESWIIGKIKDTPMGKKGPDGFVTGRVNSPLLIDRTIKRHQCNYCEKTFSFESAKERHSRIHSSEKPFDCDICKKSFSQKPEFSCESENWYLEYVKICNELEAAVNNNQECQQSEQGNPQFSLAQISKALSDANISRLNCSNKNAASNSALDSPSTLNASAPQESLNIDKIKVTPMENKGPDGFVTGRVNSLMLIDRTKKRYQCKYCEKTFSCKLGKESHSRIHSGEKPFICDICNKAFSDKSNLSRHKRMHTGLKPFICDICNKTFSRKGHLDAHKLTHTGEKPFACDICNKAFSKKFNLATHKRTHSGEKPFICNICQKAFSDKRNLEAHKRNHTE